MMQKRLCVIRGAGRRECQDRLCWSINMDGGDRLQIDMEDIKKLNQRLVETEPTKVLSRLLRKFQQAAIGRRHDHSSSSVTSRYLLDPHSLSATYLRRAVTSMRALLPSGNVPTTRVLLRISRLSRSMALLVRMRLQCAIGKRV